MDCEHNRYYSRSDYSCTLTGRFCSHMYHKDEPLYFDCRRCNVPIVHMLKELMK